MNLKFANDLFQRSSGQYPGILRWPYNDSAPQSAWELLDADG